MASFVFFEEDGFLKDREGRVDYGEVEIYECRAVRRDNVLDCVCILYFVFVARCIVIGEHEESVDIADLSQGATGEETLILRVESREVDEGRFEVCSWANILAVSVSL